MDALLLVFGYGLAFGLVSSIPTGPFAMLLLRNTVQRGRRAGLISLAGLMIAEVGYAALFQLGLDTLVLETAWLKLPLTFGGAALLGFIGVRSLRAPRGGEALDDAPQDDRRVFREATLLSLSNPSVLALLAVLLAGGVEVLGEAAVTHQPALLGGYLVGVPAWYGLVTLGVTWLPERIERALRRWVGRGVGVILLAFAAWMLFEGVRTVLTN